MNLLLSSGATIILTPNLGWNWSGWDGKLKVFSNSKLLVITEHDVILESDVSQFNLNTERLYTSSGFLDVPGKIGFANFTIEHTTLSKKIKVSTFAPLLISTTGIFTCSYEIPSIKNTPTGPIPDPIVIKTGTWKVIDPNQQILFKVHKETCIDQEVPIMGNYGIMEAEIGQSNIPGSVLNKLGDIEDKIKLLTISKTINFNKQGKHIIGHTNYQKGKSILTENPHRLLNNFHSNEILSVEPINNIKTRVDFGKVIGIHKNLETGIESPTTKGIIINSKSGAHIVPSNPK